MSAIDETSIGAPVETRLMPVWIRVEVVDFVAMETLSFLPL